MTREEAIKVAHDAWFGSFPATDVPTALISTLSALGMLKLDEPKSAREKFIEAMRFHNYDDNSCGMRDALAAFDHAFK